MSRSALVVPGQGGYLPGVFTDLTDHQCVRNTIDLVDRTASKLGRQPVSGYLTNPDAPKLEELAKSDPAGLHLSIYATGIATAGLLEEHGITPNLIIGHSFGEIAALTIAGVFDPEDGAYVAAQRDEALNQFATTPGGMVALNTNARRAHHLIGAVDAWDLAIATENASDQVVISGPHEELKRISAVAETLGLATAPLRVPYPFHNRLLVTAERNFSERIADVPRHSPHTRIYSPLLARYIDGVADVDALVVGHLTTPARFLDAVRTVHADGVTQFIESGAKSVCTDLVGKIAADGVQTFAPLRVRVDSAGLRSAVQHFHDAATVTTSETSHNQHAITQRMTTPTRETAPHPVAPSQSAPPGQLVLNADNVFATARRIYADTIGYPTEAFQPDSDLESDLGIDSIKQVEVFSKILKNYELTMPDPQPRLTSYSTLTSITQLILDIHAQQLA